MTGRELALGEVENIGQLGGPYRHRHRVLAELAVMQRRGEIAYAFSPRIERNKQGVPLRYVVSFVRLRKPRPRTPRYVGIFCAATGALAGLGGMIYHARHVIAGFIGLALAAAGVVFLLWLLAAIVRAAGSTGHCPGAWHR